MSNRLPILIVALLGSVAMAQMRIIPHLTRAGGGFSTDLIMANISEVPIFFGMKPYLEDGSETTEVWQALDVGETIFVTPEALFFRTDVSHFTLLDDTTQVHITVAYQDANRRYSQAHVPEGAPSASRWRIYPGSMSDVADGIAVVNTSGEALEVKARQLDAQGVIHEVDLFGGRLDAMAKGLYLFNDDFSIVPNSYFEIYADGPLAITALRFATSGPAYFWQTAALPMPALETTTTQTQVGQVAMLDTRAHGVSGRVTITGERTLRLEDFNYDGQGPDVYVYLAQDGQFTQGFATSSELASEPYENATVELTLPEGRTLADFNSVSIWCVAFSANFGSGVFVTP